MRIWQLQTLLGCLLGAVLLLMGAVVFHLLHSSSAATSAGGGGGGAFLFAASWTDHPRQGGRSCAERCGGTERRVGNDSKCAEPPPPLSRWSVELSSAFSVPARFNWTRCPADGPLRVFVYPHVPPPPLLDEPGNEARKDSDGAVLLPEPGYTADYFARDRRQYRLVLQELRAMWKWGDPDLLLVSDPAQACLLVPNVDPSCEHNICGDRVPKRLRLLPHWNGGVNHVLWEISDWDAPHYDTGHALLWRSNFYRRTYRVGRDVSVPLLPFYMQEGEYVDADARRGNATERHRPPSARPLLAVFKGQLPHHLDNPRHALVPLHNGVDILVSAYCCKSRWCQPRGVPCQELAQKRNETDFDRLMLDAKFALCPRGYGLHTYRLWEALHAGAVPVVIADRWVLPFVDDVRWEDIAVMVAERDVPKIPAILRALADAPDTLDAMQRAGRDALAWHMADRRTTLRRALRTTLARARCRVESDVVPAGQETDGCFEAQAVDEMRMRASEHDRAQQGDRK